MAHPNSLTLNNTTSPAVLQLFHPHFDRDFASVVEHFELPLCGPAATTQNLFDSRRPASLAPNGGQLEHGGPFTFGGAVLLQTEVKNHNGTLVASEDRIGNGMLGATEDANMNGVLDAGEDINGNGVLDTNTDTNTNSVLDCHKLLVVVIELKYGCLEKIHHNVLTISRAGRATLRAKPHRFGRLFPGLRRRTCAKVINTGYLI